MTVREVSTILQALGSQREFKNSVLAVRALSELE